MAITPRIEIRQSQSLLMTPQLRQAINLLQMTNIELNDLVNQELETNPFLEREDDVLSDIEVSNQTIDDYDNEETPSTQDIEKLDLDYDNQFDDFGSDREGYEESSDYSWEDFSKSKNAAIDEDYNYFEQKLKSENSLYKLISEQIQINFSKNYEKIIAIRLSEQLDAAGYFRGDCSKIAQALKIEEETITKILDRLKTIEPSGIFAGSLAECLEIQLKDLGKLTIKHQTVLQNLELIAAGKVKELKRISAIENDEELFSIIKDIKSLNPKPAADYDSDITSYIIPDVYVRRGKYGEYYVELNSMSLPKVLINNQYVSKIKENGDKTTNKYVKGQINSASFLVKALHQRATTILKVSEEIVKNQYEFFENGIKHLKPMLLKNISEAIEMHESTVSRVTNNKYMQTPRGLFELKYFFSSAAGSFSGDTETSTTTIKHQIKQLIENEENEKVLSDDKIVEILAAKGVKIARRTITKYRESLGIPTSAERKRTKRSKI